MIDSEHMVSEVHIIPVSDLFLQEQRHIFRDLFSVSLPPANEVGAR